MSQTGYDDTYNKAQILENKKNIEELTKRFNKYEKDVIHDQYKMRQLITEAVDAGVKPMFDGTLALEKRITTLENNPRDKSHKFLLGIIGFLGTVLTAIAIAIIRKQLNI